MTTTTVRLDEEELAMLDLLAPEFGGRSSALRTALRQLAATRQRAAALDALLDAWAATDGPVDEEAVRAMADRFDW